MDFFAVTAAMDEMKRFCLLDDGFAEYTRDIGPTAADGNMEFYVHETACVDHGAVIGAGTRIWHFCHIMPGARIGAGCTLGQNVFVAGGVTIGQDVKIQNNVSVYEGVHLEDEVFCGPSVVFTNVRTPRSTVSRKDQYETTRVGHDATLGANATIVCGVTIGPWAFVAAGSVVTRDVPAHALVIGVPARQTGWVCQCGVPLEFREGTARCPDCSRRYKICQSEIPGIEAT